MAKIKVKFRPSPGVPGQGRIYYLVIHERKQRQVMTEYNINSGEWDDKRADLKCNRRSQRYHYVLQTKKMIKKDLSRLRRIIKIIESRRVDYTSEDIVEEYKRMQREGSIFSFLNILILKMRYEGRLRTSEAYKSTLNSFCRFREGQDIMIDCIDKDIIDSYQIWLRQNGASKNTMAFYNRILRAAYNRAVEENLTENRKPFRKVFMGMDKTLKRALPMKTLKKIRSMDLSCYPKMEYARDMFMLSFMLRGMSFIDMAFLKKSDLKNGLVTYRRHKTGQLLTIKWTSEMQAIIDKYPTNEAGYLLPIIRNPKSMPVYAYRYIGNTINRHLKSIAGRLDLPVNLTMYVARHSWASSAKAIGIPIHVISEGMGHNSETTTQIYLASLDTSVVDGANSKLIKVLNS